MSDPFRINTRRLKSDLAALWSIGSGPETRTVHRPPGSAVEKQAHEWLRRRIVSAGLNYAADLGDNARAYLAGDSAGPSVVIGSHFNSAVAGGPLDGTLGVVAGLECLRRLFELDVALARRVESVTFTNIVAGVDRPAREDPPGVLIEMGVERGSVLADTGIPIGLWVPNEDAHESVMLEQMRAAALTLGVEPLQLPDIAVDHTQPPSRSISAGKILVRSASNCWPLTETAWQDVELSANVLVNVIAGLA